MEKIGFRSGALVLCLLLMPAADADVYRWRDADGRVHYGDQPPADAPSEPVPIDPPPPTRGAGEAERRMLDEADRRAARTARERSESRRREARAEAARERRCSELTERRRKLVDEFSELRARGYTLAQERSQRRRLDELDRTMRSNDCP